MMLRERRQRSARGKENPPLLSTSKSSHGHNHSLDQSVSPAGTSGMRLENNSSRNVSRCCMELLDCVFEERRPVATAAD